MLKPGVKHRLQQCRLNLPPVPTKNESQHFLQDQEDSPRTYDLLIIAYGLNIR